MSDFFDVEDLRQTRFINPKFERGEFSVKASELNTSKRYCCIKGHENLQKPALYPSSSSYNPKTGAFEIRGTVVVICGICKAPIQEF